MSAVNRAHWGLLAAAVLVAPGLALGEDDSYRSLIRRYADGDRYAAVRELGRLEPLGLTDEIKAVIRELKGWPGAAAAGRERTVMAAALLHTEQAVLRQGQGDDLGSHHHTKLAWTYVLLVDDLPAPTTALTSFCQRFYLLHGLLGQRLLDGPKARSFFEEGLKRFPRNAPLLLALGSLEEAVARFDDLRAQTTIPPGPDLARVKGVAQRRTNEQRIFLRKAEGLYRRALEIDPGLHEARLRLGRVLHVLDRLPEAEEAFTAVQAASVDHELLYLARLFRGRLYEQTDRVDQALAEYRAAVTEAPEAQTGHLAVSHTLDTLGDRKTAAETLEHALSLGDASRSAADPWCTYPFGQARSGQAIFDRMVRELD